MEAIIEFIFGNLFFVILVLGAIYNMFMKKKAQEESTKEQERKGGSGVPNQAPVPTKIDWKEIFRQEDAPIEKPRPRPVLSIPQQEVVKIQKPQTELEKHRAHLEEKRDEQKKKREKSEKVSPILNDEIKDSIGGNSYFHNLTKEEVVRGVVWTEVLGKPRAKKPLERFYQK